MLKSGPIKFGSMCTGLHSEKVVIDALMKEWTCANEAATIPMRSG
jgi:hypothetical protein